MKRLLLIIALLIPVSSFAITRTVTKTGSDSGNCSVLPCLTIGYGIGQMSGGDTLIIGNGNWDEDNFNPPAGSMGAPTVIQAANRNLAVIRPANGHYFSILTHSFVTFDGIYLDCNFHYTNQCGGILVSMACTNLTWKNGTVYKVAGDGTSPNEDSGIEGPFSASLISNMDFISVGAAHNSLFDHAIYLGTGAHDNTVTGCRFTNSSAYSVHNYTPSGSGTNNIIDGNTISGDGKAGILLAGGPGTRASNNIITGSLNGIESSASWTTSAFIYNNTLYSNTTWGVTMDDFGSGYPSGVVIKNNIFRSDGSGAINNAGNSGTPPVCSNNLNATSCGSTEGVSNPLFVNPAGGNFHIPSNSPAAGIGANLCSTFCTDFDGFPRTVPWDAGAFKATPPSAGFFFAF